MTTHSVGVTVSATSDHRVTSVHPTAASGDVVVTVDNTKCKTRSQLKVALDKVLQSFQGSDILTP